MIKMRDLLNEIQSFYIRDTLVRKEIFEKLPIESQNEILKLKKEFESLGYIDARTQVGPNQWARQSSSQKKQFSDKALEAFKIENKIKELIKSDEQKNKELDEEDKQKLNSRKSQLIRQIRDLETMFPHKLQSSRDNPHKKSLKLAQDELEQIELKLKS